MSVNEEFDEIIEKHFWSLIERHPEIATFLGIHKYDDKLPSGKIELLEKDVKEALKLADEIKGLDYNLLDDRRKVDYDLVLRAVDAQVFFYKDLPLWRRFPEAIETIGSSVFMVLVNERLPLEHKVKSVVGRVDEASRFLVESKERLTDPVRIYLDIGLEMGKGLALMFQTLPKLIETLGVEVVGIDKTCEKAHNTLLDYLRWLEELKENARREYAIGRENFEKILKFRGIPYACEELLKIGETYLNTYRNEVTKIISRLGYRDVDEAITQLKNEYPKNFEDIMKTYKSFVEEAKQFIQKVNFAPIPKGENVKVIETPIYMRPTIPFAAYIPPGKFEKEQVGVFLVTPPESEEKFKEHNIYSINNTVVHEAYPGHHLQLVWFNKHPSLVRLLAYNMSTELTEGWAHYCEEAIREEGFYNTDKHRLIVLLDAIWRAVRVIVDVKLHIGEMSFEEAVEMLVKESKMSREGAISEVKRYTYTPTYQLAYLIGKHLIKELENEVRDILKEKYSKGLFHKLILEEGMLPFDMLREVVLNKAKKYVNMWRSGFEV